MFRQQKRPSDDAVTWSSFLASNHQFTQGESHDHDPPSSVPDHLG
jgi:hypothetical protein